MKGKTKYIVYMFILVSLAVVGFTFYQTIFMNNFEWVVSEEE